MVSSNLQNFYILSVDFAKSDFLFLQNQLISKVRIRLHESVSTVLESEVLYMKIVLDIFYLQQMKQIMQISNKNKIRTLFWWVHC